MKIVGYKGDWTAQGLASLFRFSSKRCAYITLILAPQRADRGLHILAPLMPDLLTRKRVGSWPGTIKLGREECEMLKFRASESTCGVLIDSVLPKMFDDTPPIEDISLLREDGRPFLVTITHEHEAFFKVEPVELAELVAGIGAGKLAEEGDDQLPDEKY